VDEVKVDVVEAKPPQALLGAGHRVLTSGKELRGNENLLPLYTARAQRLADALFVFVGLGRVDVPVPEL
jgi:hypothetical protein